MKILLLDNYDSFTYNLAHLIQSCGIGDLWICKNDKIKLSDIEEFDKIMLSPGPGLPQEAGIMPELLQYYGKTKDILGICLGIQAIGEFLGAHLMNLTEVCHGIETPIHIIESDVLFHTCPRTFQVGRYHSWVVSPENLPDSIKVTAIDSYQQIMAFSHVSLPLRGVQFHPESIMTEYGQIIIQNWLSDNPMNGLK